MTPLQVNTRTVEPAIEVIEILGRLTIGDGLSSLETNLRASIDGGAKRMVVDLAGLDYIDSCGIGMIVGIYKFMAAAGGQMILAGPTKGVAKILTLTHLDKVLPIEIDVAAACASLAKSAAA